MARLCHTCAVGVGGGATLGIAAHMRLPASPPPRSHQDFKALSWSGVEWRAVTLRVTAYGLEELGDGSGKGGRGVVVVGEVSQGGAGGCW